MQNILVFNSLFSVKKISFKISLIIGFLLVLALVALYIFQVKILVSQNYQIQDYNKKLDHFSKENEVLEINLSKNNSMENLETKIKDLGFEKIDKIRFLWILEGQIVTK